MQNFSDFSLKNHNTFGIDVKAKNFISVENVEELKTVLRKNYASEVFVLGGGSNMLLTRNINKTVLHINLKGKRILEKNENEVFVEAMAGENWHNFVLWCLEQDFGGLENLSLIPGNVGTAPIQNIGAYGVELKDHFHSCTALHLQTLELKKFSAEDCLFGYRDSIFKSKEKGNFIITNVVYKLTTEEHKLNTSYGSIDTFLAEKNIKDPGIKDISDAVINIRRAKLPDPKKLGNSGSFFKNPIIPKEKLLQLRKEFPEIPSYQISEEEVKIPAGWLIEKAGFKGYRNRDAGVHQHQALVLVNYGNATGAEILALAKQIQGKIEELFGVSLQPEVNIF